MAQNPPVPVKLDIAFEVTLDTIVGADHRQTGEDDYDSTPTTILDMVVAETARQIVAKIIRDETQYRTIRDRVATVIDAAILERIGPMLDQVMESPFRRTNEYGEARGEPLTLTELVIETARTHLTTAQSPRDRDRGIKTPLAAAIEQVTTKVIAGELDAEVKAAKEQIRTRLQQAATEVLAAQAAKAVGL